MKNIPHILLLAYALITLFCACDKLPTHPTKTPLFDPHTMTSTAIVNSLYVDTIHLNSEGTQQYHLYLCDTTKKWVLSDSIFSWTPSIADTGLQRISIACVWPDSQSDTISWTIQVKGYWPESCPSYTHKYDARTGQAADLPDGYFIYAPYAQSGLCLSPIRVFAPKMIPNTLEDRPGNISISDDGGWICYVDRSRNRICLITIYGCNKTIVPVVGTDSGFPMIAGFYRNGPYGPEIYYLSTFWALRSVQVDLSTGVPRFSNDRVLAQLGPLYLFNNDDFMQLSVAKDQIFGEILPIVNDAWVYRTGYITIPDQGRGIAGDTDVYRWNTPIDYNAFGCGHTQTFDGLYCLSNPGEIGNPSCVPHNHNGFYITNFRHTGDPPIDFRTEQTDKYAISINWCPLEYQNYSMAEVDFWGWYFGNSDEYVIGRQLGSLGQNGIWMVHWQENIWYRLSPAVDNILTLQPAVYFYNSSMPKIDSTLFCQHDSSQVAPPYNPNDDWFNPRYCIKSPNGGEVLIQGHSLEIKLFAAHSGSAILSLSLNGGKNYAPLLPHPIDPLIDTLILYTIPDSLLVLNEMRSTISNQCLLQIMDYGNSKYFDRSDSVFSIVARQ